MNFDKLSVWDRRESLSPFMFHSVQASAFLLHMLTFERPKALKCRAFGGSRGSCRAVAAIHSEHIKHHHSPSAFSPPALLFQTISLSWGKCISLFFPSGLMFHLSLVSTSQQCSLNDGFSRKLGLAVSSAVVLYIKGGNASPAQSVNYVSANAGGQTGHSEVNLP